MGRTLVQCQRPVWKRCGICSAWEVATLLMCVDHVFVSDLCWLLCWHEVNWVVCPQLITLAVSALLNFVSQNLLKFEADLLVWW